MFGRMFVGNQVSAETRAYLGYLELGRTSAELPHDTALVTKYREYVDGDQNDVLNEDQRALLGIDFDPMLNVCEIVVSVPADRLKVRDIHIERPDITRDERNTGIEDELSAQLTAALRDVWDENRMDNSTADLHWMAGRDGEAFLVTEYVDSKVSITYHDLYDGVTGMYAVYGDDDKATPRYFVKRWKETPLPTATRPEDRHVIQRMNVYWPNRVEKWAQGGQYNKGSWQPYTTDGTQLETVDLPDHGSYEAAVVWWTSDESPLGTPLGFPVFHYRANSNGSANGKSDLINVVPSFQDNLNRAFAMQTAAEQLAGTPINFITGARVPEELNYFPGALIEIPNVQNASASVSQVPAANITQLTDAVDAKIRWIATITKVPLAYFNVTGQVSAEGTQKQAELPLIAKVERRQLSFGAQYEALARMVVKLLATFDPEFTLLDGDLDGTLEYIDTLAISCTWEPAEVRDEDAEIARAVQLVSSLEVPVEYGWKVAGIPVEDIAKLEKDRQRERTANMIAAMRGQSNPLLNPPQEEAENGTNEDDAGNNQGTRNDE